MKFVEGADLDRFNLSSMLAREEAEPQEIHQYEEQHISLVANLHVGVHFVLGRLQCL